MLGRRAESKIWVRGSLVLRCELCTHGCGLCCVTSGEEPIEWAADAHSLYIYRPGELPAKVYGLDLATGERTLWRQLMPSDPAGVERIGPVRMTPDGKTYVYGYHRTLADLYLVEGLK